MRQPGLVLFLLAAFSLPCLSADSGPKYGPPGAPKAIPLSHDSDYFRNSPAPDFWALIPYYVPQFNEYSCSAASVTIILNGALRAGKTLKDEDKNFTQEALLDGVTAIHWKERMHKGGFEGKVGLTLAQLKTVVEESLRRGGARSFQVLETQINQADAKSLERWRFVLENNERSAADFVLIHFVQDAVTGAQGGPYAHISPVGAYDRSKKRVLILDVDRGYYEPYWVSDGFVLQAMARKTAAFGSGGYLVIQVKN